jgi:hypothetical protein
MKISDPKGAPSSEFNALQRVTPAGAEGLPAIPAGPSLRTDQIQLSSLSAYLNSARSDSPVRLTKLSSLAGAVSSGSYSVDVNLVSASIIEHGLEFGGANYP